MGVTHQCRRGPLAVGAVLALLFSFVGLTAGVTPALAAPTPVGEYTWTIASITPNPALTGQSVQLCASVETGARNGIIVPGSVNFTGPEGFGSTGTLVNGETCVTVMNPATGNYTATFPAGSGYESSDDTVAMTVNPAATTLAVMASVNSPVTGQSVSFCAAVSVAPPGSGTPSGTVSFTGVATGTATLVGGAACYTTSNLSSGTVTATYTGNSGFSGSSNTVTVVVEAAATTTTVAADINPSVTGQIILVCATVAVVAPGAGSPTGAVSFSGMLAGTAGINLSGVGCLSGAALATGPVAAVYSGDAEYTGSTGGTPLTVSPAETTVTSVTAPNPSVTGQSVEICATVVAVSPGAGTPTGTVTFTGAVSGTATVTNGEACYTTPASSNGNLTATYSGGGGFGPSTGTGSVTVDPASTTLVVTADPSASAATQPVEVCATATATAPGSGTPGGTVLFTGPGLNEGAVLDDGEACLTTTGLSTGSVTATYAGNSLYEGSEDSATVTVGLMPTTTVLTATRDGDEVELCATVTAQPSPVAAAADLEPPVFTFTFTGLGDLDQTVALDDEPTVCITVPDVDGGTITATFNGGAYLGGSSGTATVDPAPQVAPSMPLEVTLAGGVSSVLASWEPPATGATVTGYTVTADPGPAFCTTTGETTCLLGGTAGTTYTVTVVAQSDDGDSLASEVSNPATPTAPEAPPSPPVSDLTLTTTDGDISVAEPGQRIVFVGSGFLPYSTVVVTIYSAPLILGTVVTDANGDFQVAVTLPAKLAAGEHTVVALGLAPDGTTRAMNIEVTVAAVVAALPVTGPAITLLLMAGAGLAVTGTGLVLVGRIRPRRRRLA